MCEVASWVMLMLLGIIAVLDWKTKGISLWLIIAMFIAVIFFSCFCEHINIKQRLWGLVFGVVVFVMGKITKEGIGYGDCCLITILGIYFGLVKVLQLLLVATVTASIFALFYLWKQKWNRKERLPFVPFLLLGYIGVMFG